MSAGRLPPAERQTRLGIATFFRRSGGRPGSDRDALPLFTEVHRARVSSVVEFGRVFGRLEELGVMRHEDLRVLGIPDEPDALIALVHPGRTPGAGNRRDKILVEILL